MKKKIKFEFINLIKNWSLPNGGAYFALFSFGRYPKYLRRGFWIIILFFGLKILWPKKTI